MGDVYNAMARARRERGNRAEPLDANLSPTLTTEGEDPAEQSDRLASALTASSVESRSAAANSPQADRSGGNKQILARQKSGTPEPPGTHGIFATLRPRPFEARRKGYAESIVVHHDRGSIIAEQYRGIRTQILSRHDSRRLQTYVITSALTGEGRSVTTVNLGVCFAELKNTKALVVEGDLRRPNFDTLFACPCPVGLSQYLRGQIDNADEVLYPTIYENLQFLPAGPGKTTGIVELLSSPRLTQMLNHLKNRFDHIFIDTPPVMTIDDAKIIGAICDQTLLVVRLHRTAIELVDHTKRTLRAANCQLAGLVMTHADDGLGLG